MTTTLYDADNNVTGTIDPNGNRSTFAFDTLNRETTTTDARGGVTTMVYDLDNNEVNLIDPVSNKSTFSFDALDRETSMTDPLGATATYAYNGADQQTSVTDRDGRVTNTIYDPLGRETGQTWISGGSTVNVFTFTYDAADNQLSAANYNGAYTMGYDALNRITSEQEPFGLSLTFNYDGDNNRTLVQDSFGGVLTSLYDSLDRLTSRQFGGASQTPLRFDLSYNSRNDINTVNRYSDLAGTTKVGYSTYSYDSVNRVTNIEHQNGLGSILANFTYGYDSGSRVTSEDANGSTRTFQYDKDNELTSDGLYSYTFDLNGNRTMSGYTTGTGNELTGDGTWTYAYDGEGNTVSKRRTSTGETWTYGYDNANHMTSAKDVSGSGTTLTLATYLYDGLGNQIEEDVWTQSSGTTTVSRFGYDGNEAWADIGNGNALQTRYIRGDEVDQLFARIASSNVAWYLTDWQGSVRNLTDGGGALQDTIVYDGFGNITSETNTSAGGSYKYNGYSFDSITGSCLTPHRVYSPANGRWDEQDPVGLKPDSNPYRYAGNSPTNQGDPTGLEPPWRRDVANEKERELIDRNIVMMDAKMMRMAGMALAPNLLEHFLRNKGGKAGDYPVTDLTELDEVKTHAKSMVEMIVAAQCQSHDWTTETTAPIKYRGSVRWSQWWVPDAKLGERFQLNDANLFFALYGARMNLKGTVRRLGLARKALVPGPVGVVVNSDLDATITDIIAFPPGQLRLLAPGYNAAYELEHRFGYKSFKVTIHVTYGQAIYVPITHQAPGNGAPLDGKAAR